MIIKRVINEIPEAFSLERIEISEKIIHELAIVMNEIHQTNYSFRFWKIVIGDYVNAIISIMHLLQKEVLSVKPSVELINSHSLPTLRQQLIARLPTLVKHFRHIDVQHLINKLLRSNDSFTINLPDIEAVSNTLGVPLPAYYPIYPGRGNIEKRKRANALAEKYSDIFYKNIVLQIPKIYVEYFDREFDSIRLFNPAKKIFHTHGIPPFSAALMIAKYIENGAKLICYQHGAYYGEMIGHNAHFNETSLADEYRTWGWKIKSNDVPWKAYRLEKFKLQYDTFQKTNAFDFLMCYPDVYDANLAFYKTGTAYFLQNINSSKYKNLLARPRPLNKIFSHASRISFIKDSRVTIDSGLGNMAGVIAKCKMVIQFTIPATNFFECLYVDHPTMGLLDNDQPTEIVKPYYDFLIQHGVIHMDFVSLVNHLNKINVDEWWAGLIKEPMYLEFKNEFLRKV